MDRNSFDGSHKNSGSISRVTLQLDDIEPEGVFDINEPLQSSPRYTTFKRETAGKAAYSQFSKSTEKPHQEVVEKIYIMPALNSATVSNVNLYLAYFACFVPLAVFLALVIFGNK